jgi:uncharacterized alkaline shock family protein YloU
MNKDPKSNNIPGAPDDPKAKPSDDRPKADDLQPKPTDAKAADAKPLLQIPIPSASGGAKKTGDLLPVASGETLSSRGDGTGRTSIEDPVYFEIAYREARSVPGVVDVKGSFFEMLTGHGKGIHVKTSDTAVLLELRLALEYGRFIPDVVVEIRKRISTAIKRMTDREVRSIKVTIDRLVEGYDFNYHARLDHDEDTEHIDF